MLNGDGRDVNPNRGDSRDNTPSHTPSKEIVPRRKLAPFRGSNKTAAKNKPNMIFGLRIGGVAFWAMALWTCNKYN